MRFLPRLHVRMVNRRFPPAQPYGFELVDAADCFVPDASMQNLRRIQHVAFATIFRRIKPNAITCALSRMTRSNVVAPSPQPAPTYESEMRDVLSAAHGLLARAGAGAVAAGQDA